MWNYANFAKNIDQLLKIAYEENYLNSNINYNISAKNRFKHKENSCNNKLLYKLVSAQ